MSNIISETIKHCIIRCMMTKICKSINFNRETTECEISEHTSKTENLENRKGWFHLESTDKEEICNRYAPCPNHDYCSPICQSPWYKCKCNNEVYGKLCDTSPCQNGGVCKIRVPILVTDADVLKLTTVKIVSPSARNLRFVRITISASALIDIHGMNVNATMRLMANYVIPHHVKMVVFVKFVYRSWLQMQMSSNLLRSKL